MLKLRIAQRRQQLRCDAPPLDAGVWIRPDTVWIVADVIVDPVVVETIIKPEAIHNLGVAVPAGDPAGSG